MLNKQIVSVLWDAGHVKTRYHVMTFIDLKVNEENVWAR